MPQLPEAFLSVPLAHRGLHDRAAGRVENSPAAIRAAMDAGYGAEIDVQLTADGQAVVFHDDRLTRLTGFDGAVRALSAAELGRIPLSDSEETIPTLPEVLDLVDARIPLLIEIKDQDGALGPDVGPLERAVAAALAGYRGPVAVMSFNPHSIARMAALLPDVARGLVSCDFNAADWPDVPAARRGELRRLTRFAQSGAGFLSHDVADLQALHVKQKRDAGVPLLCWTVRSPGQEAQARALADNITFEGYLPHQPDRAPA